MDFNPVSCSNPHQPGTAAMAAHLALFQRGSLGLRYRHTETDIAEYNLTASPRGVRYSLGGWFFGI